MVKESYRVPAANQPSRMQTIQQQKEDENCNAMLGYREAIDRDPTQ